MTKVHGCIAIGELGTVLDNRTDFESFFGEAPAMNPARAAIKGVICGVRVEEVEEPLMREIHDRAHAISLRARVGHGV